METKIKHIILPQAPATEFEWFKDTYRDKGYSLGASPGGNPCVFAAHASGWFSKKVETKELAIQECYEHWRNNPNPENDGNNN